MSDEEDERKEEIERIVNLLCEWCLNQVKEVFPNWSKERQEAYAKEFHLRWHEARA